ncbi:hypothetical protein GNY91_09810 [Glaesserella parasuis]|uniref:hypothetical protein n=1 Tax=Glaesserella parasuis TaxID=738 RepID=UPI0013222AB4|nr:hypothetical protein [Glaesserella parasuis]MDG6247741.1 hypothetical protein [Glaesserella parasuis]MXP17613.1 hypothetical protein [Glaesserella parasuis]
MKKLSIILMGLVLVGCGDYRSMTLRELATLPQGEAEKIREKMTPDEIMSIAFTVGECTDSYKEMMQLKEFPKKCSLTVGEYLNKKK